MVTNAEKFFEENRNIVGLPRFGKTPEPEKYNLYTGLSVMAKQLNGIESTLDAMRHDLQRLKVKVDRL